MVDTRPRSAAVKGLPQSEIKRIHIEADQMLQNAKNENYETERGRSMLNMACLTYERLLRLMPRKESAERRAIYTNLVKAYEKSYALNQDPACKLQMLKHKLEYVSKVIINGNDPDARQCYIDEGFTFYTQLKLLILNESSKE